MTADEKLERYELELIRWNERMNLLGPAARAELRAHLREAREAGSILRPEGEVLDLGSGNGIPAIPIAIDFPDVTVHMVEADQRKWAFLKHVARVCKLSCEVHGDRFEQLLETGLLDGRISLLISRAVAAPERWLPPAGRLMKENGRVGLFRTGPDLPPIDGFRVRERHEMKRGEGNYLIELERI